MVSYLPTIPLFYLAQAQFISFKQVLAFVCHLLVNNFVKFKQSMENQAKLCLLSSKLILSGWQVCGLQKVYHPAKRILYYTKFLDLPLMWMENFVGYYPRFSIFIIQRLKTLGNTRHYYSATVGSNQRETYYANLACQI